MAENKVGPVLSTEAAKRAKPDVVATEPAVAVMTAANPSPRVELEGETMEFETLEVQMPKEEPRSKYWIGTIESSPFQNITLGGHTFHTFIDEPVGDSGSDTYRRLGQVVELSEGTVKAMKDDIARKVIRVMGSKSYIERVDSSEYRRDSRDVPMAAYVYMVKVKDSMPTAWREFTPKPMAIPKR